MEKFGHWLQIGANVGLLAGLVLVALQLQQNTHLARATLIASQMESWVYFDQSNQSETFAVVLAKAVDSPEKLTNAEMLELTGYLRAALDLLNSHVILTDLGLFGSPLQESVGSSVKQLFGNRFAIAWWAENRNEWGTTLRSIVDRSIAEAADFETYDQRKLDRIRSRLQPP